MEDNYLAAYRVKCSLGRTSHTRSAVWQFPAENLRAAWEFAEDLGTHLGKFNDFEGSIIRKRYSLVSVGCGNRIYRA